MRRFTRPYSLPPRGRSRYRRAQALTEFAIVAPVMVTCLLFAMYFYEIIQIKLKAQEVGRFAAWEFTSYPLHDYDTGKTSGHFSNARAEITGHIASYYANLKSCDRRTQSKWFMVEWQPPSVMMTDQIEPSIPGGSMVNQLFNFAGYAIDALTALSLNYANPVLMAMMVGYYSEKASWFGSAYNRFNPPRKWGFNPKGYPRARVRLRYKNLMINKKFMEGGSGWYTERHFQGTKRAFTETAAVVADSYRLHYGDNIEGTKDSQKPYFKQVDRMAFVTPAIRNGMKMWTTLIQALSGGIAMTVLHPPLTVDPLGTTLISKAYKGGDPDSGKVTLIEDHEQESQKYDSSPMPPGSEYEKSLQVRGSSFMGCQDPEKLGCFDSLSSDNPFGDYVLPPETP